MRSICRLAPTGLVLACAACAGFGGRGDRVVTQTADFQTDSQFHFSISPDDHWLVFFKRLTEDEIGTRDAFYGNLRLLEISTGKVHSFTLAQGLAPRRINAGDPCWSADSRELVLPPPSLDTRASQNGILVDLSNANDLRVVAMQIQHGPDRRIDVAGQNHQMPDEYTCSDCSPHQHDVELMKKHVDAKYLHWGDLRINRNDNASQIVSPDGTKIYFQKGRQTKEVTLHEFDIASGKERELTAHAGECAMLDRLRPSPDGRKLAYQLTTGCDFVGPAKVYVIDLATRDREYIAEASGGTMHWTRACDRLYFYRSNYLHVAEFAKPPVPASAPKSAPVGH